MKRIKLRECPFCGSEMIEVSKLNLLNSWCSICSNCGCTGPGEHKTADQAARAWNKRKGAKLELASLYGNFARER